MELIVARVSASDYDVFCEWWKFWRFPAPPKEFLPNNGFGGLKISVKENDILTDVCAGFLYETNSKVAWLEFVVASPKVRDKNIRKEALNELLTYLIVDAEKKGYEYIFSSLKNDSLIDRYKDVGFQESKGHTEMVIKLG